MKKNYRHKLQILQKSTKKPRDQAISVKKSVIIRVILIHCGKVPTWFRSPQ